MNEFTTIEKLALEIRSGYDVIICYKNYVCLAAMNFNSEYNTEIYEFVDEPDIDGFLEIECRISMIEKSDKTFNDSGSAIKWCFDKLDK